VIEITTRVIHRGEQALRSCMRAALMPPEMEIVGAAKFSGSSSCR
jgi:hypothetical protein